MRRVADERSQVMAFLETYGRRCVYRRLENAMARAVGNAKICLEVLGVYFHFSVTTPLDQSSQKEVQNMTRIICRCRPKGGLKQKT